VMVGNKADLEQERRVSSLEVETFVKPRRIPFIETSAKDGANC